MRSPVLLIGVVLKAQGLTGEVKVQPLTDDPHRFAGLDHVLVERDGGHAPIAMAFERVHQGFVYLRLEGASTRTQAEAQRGWRLYVDRAHAVKLPEGSWFIADLIGCRVEDTRGSLLGMLKDVMQPGANDVYVVKRAQGEMLVPAIARVLRRVDAENGVIVLDEQVLEEVAVFED